MLYDFGWHHRLSVGCGALEAAAIKLHGYWRKREGQSAEYLIAFDQSEDDEYWFAVKTTDLIAFLDAFSRWVPIVQADRIVDLVDEVGYDSGLEKVGKVEIIAAKARYGMTRTFEHLATKEE